MPIEKFTLSLVTYRPFRSFPGTLGKMGHWDWETGLLPESCDEILIIEKVDPGQRGLLQYGSDRFRVIVRPNDPPYADPFRQVQLDEAKNDWVLILDDDERLSAGALTFMAGLATADPAPGRDWVAVRFPREDYIYHQGCWRYVPANGADHQTRLVNRKRVKWGAEPHTVPAIEGLVLTVAQPGISILHYRDYDKIMSWTKHCNEMFADKPEIVEMQNAYIERVNMLMGIKTETMKEVP